MSDFQIEERGNLDASNKQFQRFEPDAPSKKGMLGFLMRKGIVKSENAGNYVLIGVALFFFAMSALMFVIL
jgi:hypothetical protein